MALLIASVDNQVQPTFTSNVLPLTIPTAWTRAMQTI